MGVEITVEGAENFRTLSQALRKFGEKDLRKELFASIHRATKPTRAKIRENALDVLPARGGLGAIIAASRISTRTRGGGRNPGIRIMATSKHDVNAMNRGRLRHPVFGRRGTWVDQSVPPGWFSKPIEDDAERIRQEIADSMAIIAEKFLSKH